MKLWTKHFWTRPFWIRPFWIRPFWIRPFWIRPFWIRHGVGLASLVFGMLLVLLVLLLLLVTQFGFRTLRSDTLTVELGFEASASPRARAFDQHVLEALERGYFGTELRRRLDRPAQQVQLDAFWADTCEVRQLDFERFGRWQSGRNAAVLDEEFDPSAVHSISSGHRIAGLLQSPASGINYAAATTYCAAAGGRLPWADEWEAMAVGTEGRLYPWGNDFDDSAWPYQSAHRNAAQSCALHPEAASPEGVQDLAGGVMEWSRGQRDAHPQERQPGAHGAPAARVRGRPLYALAAAWLAIEPQTLSHHLGFRCVYPAPPAATLSWGAKPKVVAIPAGVYPLGVPEDLRLARVAVLLPAARQVRVPGLVSQAPGTRRLEASRCEVSRREYRAFLRHPLARLGLFANEHEPKWQAYRPHNWQAQRQDLDLPVSGVNWWAADAFARWAGGRLPRVEEWQLLAAGADANTYPWGNEYVVDRATTGDQAEPGVRPCAAAAGDVTATGVQDLAGNVSEWTLSVTAERGDYVAWVQGGNWLLPGKTTARSVFGRLVPLTHRSDSIGFRVVYD